MEIYSRSDRSITQGIIANQCATNMDVLIILCALMSQVSQ